MDSGDLFALLGRLFEMPAPRRAKCETLHQLAQTVTDGVIVELGTWHGLGAITLALSASVPVYTVDDFANRHGWAGEPYGPDDLDICYENIKEANAPVEVVIGDVREVARDWDKPIGLLFWDLGCRGRVVADVAAWLPHVVKGGALAIHDTYDRQLGSIGVAMKLGRDDREMPGGVWVF